MALLSESVQKKGSSLIMEQKIQYAAKRRRFLSFKIVCISKIQFALIQIILQEKVML